MSSPGVILYDARGNKLAPSRYSRGPANNALHSTATQNSDRKRIPALDYDVHRTVTNFGRRTMLTLGRFVYANFPQIRGAVNEQAEFATSTFFPQFYGANPQWNLAAEMLLENHDSIIDVAGPPYNMRAYRRNLIIAKRRDGDMLTVLVKGPGGWPMIQCIGGHRVGSREGECEVSDAKSPYDGARLVDGVIVNEFNRPIAYRVSVGDNPFDFSQTVDISARDCFLSFDPVYPGQLRGFSDLGSVAWHCLDVKESDDLERVAQKLAASIGLVEKNPAGEADDDPLQRDDGGVPVKSANANGANIHAKETVTDSGVTVRYFASGDPNSGLDKFILDRPTQNQQSFRNQMIRDAFAGIDWSVDYSLDPTKIGGAPARVMVDKLNRTLRGLQDFIVRPAVTRIDGYRVGVFMSAPLGLLPYDPDWWKVQYQGPAELTADRKYQSDVDKQEISRGMKTRRRALAERGDYIDDVDAELARDADARWSIAAQLAQKRSIPIETAYNSIWSESPNGITPQKEPAGDFPAKSE